MVSRVFRPPSLGRVRIASMEDANYILELVNDSMAANFRIQNTNDIIYLLQNCVLSICQLDANDAIVGFLSAKDSPMLPSVHPRAWEEYIWTKYKAIELKARNTLFIHLLCWSPMYARELVDSLLTSMFMHDAYLHHVVMIKTLREYPRMLIRMCHDWAIELKARNTLFIHLLCWSPMYARELVDSLLTSMFMHDAYLHHVVMIKTLREYPLLVPGQARAEGGFRRIQAMERGVPGDLLPALLIADRTEISPRLRIRRAVEEDNDDIVPIIERQSVRLHQMYGDFYVSELISRHPESERVLLVCEHKELAVGVMCLNTQINFESLEESFELSPFGGLRHIDAKSDFKACRDIAPSASISLCNMNNADAMAQVPSQIDYGTRVKDTKANVTWLFNGDDFKDFRTESSAPNIRMPPPQSSPQLDVLGMLDDDEEELEFDIINIDTNLLRVPKILTYDTLGKGLAESIMRILDDTAKLNETEEKFSRKEKRQFTTATGPVDKMPEPKHFSGTSNAFVLELFAMHQDYDERYGFDMLEAAYELFPDRDYCILCLPSNHPPFPLLEHFTLVTTYGTQMRFINETLYVAHINSVRGDIAMRPGEASDMTAMNDILEHAPRAQSLMDLFGSSFDSSNLNSFVLLSQKQPIGMIILGPLKDGVAIRTQYDLDPEPRRPATDGTVLAGVMSPALEPHGRWYMRELLRYTQYTTLFWICRLFAKGDVSPNRNMMSLSGHMVPVQPRRAVPNISGNKGLDSIFQDAATPFALWVIERPLTSLPKVTVNNSIVVVGASRTGLAFLETLIMGHTCQYLTFTNITLVSEHGLPTVVECLKAALTCVPREGRYTDRYLKSVPFYYYLDVMSAVMVHIDRKMKCIHLKGGGVKFYDELVLTCGHQFQHPEYLHESLELAKEVEKGKPCDRILMDNPRYKPDRVRLPPDSPENLMLINSLYTANVCMRKLLRMISEDKESKHMLSEDNPVVVYGECTEAYNCLAALLELGLAAQMISFVEPFPPEEESALRVNCFNDEIVDERVQSSIEKLGIRVYRQCSLAGWRQVGYRIEAVHLMAPLHAVRLPCFAFFYYGMKAIDIDAFKAINESGLVYDGGLVVGPMFETNDPHIYGAGSCARYSRRLYADRLQHRHYCSEDVGEALANIFLRKLDPFVTADPDASTGNSTMMFQYSSSLLLNQTQSHASFSSLNRVNLGLSRRWQPVMKFESPIVRYSVLPGPLYYMKLRNAGPEIPMEVQLCLPHQGHTLTTDKGGNFFRLKLNALHCVDAITCLSKKLFSPELLTQLYGKHEAFFNELLCRYQSNTIVDLYEFFMQPWMAVLYQETFVDLLRDINEQDVGSVYDMVWSKFTLDEKFRSSGHNSCSPDGSCNMFPSSEMQHSFGTFRSVIDKFVAKKSSTQIVKVSKAVDIPSECGQSAALRDEARSYWRTTGGEQIVMSHIARYLNRNSVTNPHYARPVQNHE